MFSQLQQTPPSTPSAEGSHFVESLSRNSKVTAAQLQTQFELAAHPAVKISVHHEGWYRISQSDLVKAGLSPSVDPALLHLYAEGIEQPTQITGAGAGPGGFGPQGAINFYGTGIDTAFSATRVYWLVSGEEPGKRIPRLQLSAGSNLPPSSYPATAEIREHTIYFAALLTSDDNNFFGALVSSTPVDQVLRTPHLDLKSTRPAQLEILLQGVIVAYPHLVEVAINGTPVGSITFTGQEKGSFKVTVPPGVLQEGTNTVTLTSQNGDFDISLVESIRLTYPHLYAADDDYLKCSGRAGDELNLTGFTSVPTVIDITDPDHPSQISVRAVSTNGSYAVGLQVPWTTSTGDSPVRHMLLAVADDRMSTAPVNANHPSRWHAPQSGADIVMLTAPEFASTLAPLVHAHQAQGLSSAVVQINDIYDEFNFGERSPFAVRQFLQSATQNWKTPPRYLLLNGRASLDPRNYLGFGNLDLVPTRILPLSSLMTASDDWFSDFAGNGMPTIATGRLPVGTVNEATTVVGKIAAYESLSSNGGWTSQALMVADKNDTENFSGDTQQVQAQLPTSMQVTDVFTSTVGTAAAQQQIINGINSGQLLVNYLGHGSEEQWSGSPIFDTNSLPSLTNATQLPVFLIMDCLNGFFQDVYSQPLGVSLMLAPNGGAVAVLASTGLNQPTPQVKLDALVLQNAFSASHPTLGDSILKAKSHIGDAAVRRTFVLFGDPAMGLKQSSTAHSH